MNITRRTFIIRTAQLGAALLIPVACGRNGSLSDLGNSQSKSLASDDDHFFLHIVPSYPAGWDSQYLFDARPLEMTEKGIVQNYLGEHPFHWIGKNGTRALASPLVRPLIPYRDYFSVVNGAQMAKIDGHGPNFNFLFSGNALGGPSFIPRLNQVFSQPCTLDAVQHGYIFAVVTNDANIVPFEGNAARRLAEARPSEEAVLDVDDPLFRYVSGRMRALGEGEGEFSTGAEQMAQSMTAAPSTARRLEALGLHAEDTPNEASFVRLAVDLFRKRIARSAIVVLDKKRFNYDTHAASNAKLQPLAYRLMMRQLGGVLKALRETPFDDKRSAMDVVTFLVSSEFGRTMRQDGHPIDDTGTDHNPLSNSVLIGGKGIRSGLVLGESDFQNADEALTPAHLALDPTRLRAIGRPFDFRAQRPMAKPPEVPQDADYLNFGSVINTLFGLFSVEKKYHWKFDGSERPAPVLDSLLL